MFKKSLKIVLSLTIAITSVLSSFTGCNGGNNEVQIKSTYNKGSPPVKDTEWQLLLFLTYFSESINTSKV